MNRTSLTACLLLLFFAVVVAWCRGIASEPRPEPGPAGGGATDPATVVGPAGHGEVSALPRPRTEVAHNESPLGGTGVPTQRPDAATAWRVRVLDAEGRALRDFEARWLRRDLLSASPTARALAQRHEGQRQFLFSRLGQPLEPDADGLLLVPWLPEPSAVGVSAASGFGAVQLQGPPAPEDVQILRLEPFARCEVVVVRSDGSLRPETRIDALWLHDGGAERTPLGFTDQQGVFALTSDVATLQYLRERASSGAELGVGIPGHGPEEILPQPGRWTERVELHCLPSGTLRVRAASDDHDLVGLRASLRLREIHEPDGRWFAIPIRGDQPTDVEVAVGREFAWEIEGGAVTHRLEGRLLGPRATGESVDLEWQPVGLCTFHGLLAGAGAELPAGATLQAHLDAPDDPLFPRIAKARLTDSGRFRVTLDAEDLRGARSLSLRSASGDVYGPVGVAVREGVFDVGVLLREALRVSVAHVEVWSPDGTLLVAAEVTAGDPVVVSGGAGHFDVTVPAGFDGVPRVHAAAPGHEPTSVELLPSPGPRRIVLQPRRALTVAARIDEFLEVDALRATWVPSGRVGDSRWARVERTAADRVTFHWDGVLRGAGEVSLLVAWPPRELVRLQVPAGESAVSLPEQDLRGQRRARWRVAEPTGPVHLVQWTEGSNLHGDAVVAPAAGGTLVLDQPADILLVRAGSRPLRCTVAPGQDLDVSFPAAVEVRAAWRDDPEGPACDAPLRVAAYEPPSGEPRAIRIWLDEAAVGEDLLDLVGAPASAAADGFPLFLDGRYQLERIPAVPGADRVTIELRGDRNRPSSVLLDR